MTRKHWFWIILFSLLIPTVCFMFASCGGGGGGSADIPQADQPLTQLRSGGHMLPLWVKSAPQLSASDKRIHTGKWFMDPDLLKDADETVLEYPTAYDFERLKRWGDNVIINFPVNWTTDGWQRQHLLNLIDYAHDLDMNLYLRMEDWRCHINYGAPEARIATDDVWFSDIYEPYLIDIAEYCSGRFTTFGSPWKVVFTVFNEPFERDRFLMGPDLPFRIITPAEYVELVRKTVEALRDYPDIEVWNGGFTSPTEANYFTLIRQCIDAGLEQYIPVLNLHCYVDSFSGGDMARIRALRNQSVLPWALTEYNHIDPNASDASKWSIMQKIYNALQPEIALAFLYRGDLTLPVNTRNFRIIDTDLETYLVNAVREES